MTSQETAPDPGTTATEFFDRYAAALLARDAHRIAALYAVPALILFPGQILPVGSVEQTEQFFASAFDQYEGITDTATDIDVVASTGESIWADVTWHHDNGTGEHLMYQLVSTEDGWRIAVLTPLT